MKNYTLLLLCLALCLNVPVHGQTERDSLLQQKKLEKRIAVLEQYIRQLEDEKQKQKEEDELKKLMEEARQLGQQERKEKVNQSKKFQSGIRKQQGMNPNISMGGDFYASYLTTDDPYVVEGSDISYGYNRFELREMELGLESSLDPFTRGKTFISITSEAIAIEEAYMEWLNLPLNMNLKIGKFYSEFGYLNRYHDHALPQFDRPRVLVNQFSLGALGGVGFAADFMMPTILGADASGLNLSVINGGADITFASSFDQGVLATGMLKNFYDINDDSYIEFRLSGAGGRNPVPGKHNSYVGNIGIAYKWLPVGRAKYRSLDWKTEVQYSLTETNTEDHKATGFYTSLVARLNARLLLGGRLGYAQMPYQPDDYEWDYTVNLDFWQSEFVFTRFQYQYVNRQLAVPGNPSVPDNHMFLIQVCWAMGPHKHEAY